MNTKEIQLKINSLYADKYNVEYSTNINLTPEIKNQYINDINAQIAMLEDHLDFEKRFLKFKLTLYAFAVFAIGIAIYAYIKQN